MLRRTLAALSILSLAVPFAAADHIDVTIATDNATSTPSEALRFHVTAHHLTAQDLTLPFGSSLQAVYALDGTSQFPHFGAAVLTHRSIPANGSYTWTHRQ